MAEIKEPPRAKGNGAAGVAKEPAIPPQPVPPKAAAVPAPVAAMATPFGFIKRFAEEMDRLFEDFGVEHGFRMPGFLTRGHELLRRETGLVPADWSPHIDVQSRDGGLYIRADLPGIPREAIKVEVADDTLTIQGERKKEVTEEEKGYTYSECSYGSFYRAIPLPTGVDPAKVEAVFRNGVLEVNVPMAAPPSAKVRRIEVREPK